MAQALIGGERVGAKSGEEMPVVNPATEEQFETVPKAGLEDVDAAVAAAKSALREWSGKDPDERAGIMRSGIEKIEERSEEIARLLVQEQGKPMMEAMGELHHFLHGMNFYADLASKIRGAYAPLPSTFGTSYGMVIKRPIGVCAAIVPYNFPLTLMGTKVGPALAGGNTIVVKPANTTPLATLRIAELMQEAGLPADVDNAVRGVNIGRFFNAGQACLAAKRVYVFEEVYDEFMEGLVKRVSRYELGDGMQKAEKHKIRMGTMNTRGQRDEASDQLQEAVD